MSPSPGQVYERDGIRRRILEVAPYLFDSSGIRVRFFCPDVEPWVPCWVNGSTWSRWADEARLAEKAAT